MNDSQRFPGQLPDEPAEPIDWTTPFPQSVETPAEPGRVEFRGRTRTKTQAVRAGIVAGTGVLVVVAAAVAMGASPAAVSSGGASPAASEQPAASGELVPERQEKVGRGWAFGGPGGPLGGPGLRAGRAFGQISITAINGSDVSLKTDDGWTRTITVATSTSITKGGQPATLSELKVGDVIRFAETRNADGSYAITRIEIVVPQVAGVVTAVGADTITVTGRNGVTATIRTSSSTTYHVGQANGSRSDVKVGSAIIASGTKAADGSLDASSVTVLLPRVAGKVTAKTADTITITRPNGSTQTIHVSSTTTYDIAGANGGSLADIAVGMRVLVEGSTHPDGSIDAAAIEAGRLRGSGGREPAAPAPNASTAPNASGGTTG
jgi:hypothetical protein